MTKLRLKVEVLDWTFDKDGGLEIAYMNGNRVCSLRLGKEQLLDYLSRSFIIDSFTGDTVRGSVTIDTFTPRLEHKQRTYKFEAKLVDFMKECFGFEEANRLAMFHEEQQKVKQYARHFATRLQNTISRIKP